MMYHSYNTKKTSSVLLIYIIFCLLSILCIYNSATGCNVGLKRVELKEDKSFAEQLIHARTIYIIKHDFDLNDKNAERPIVIPYGSTLLFEGGCLRGGGVVKLSENCSIVKGVFEDVIVQLDNNSSVYSSYFKGGNLNASCGTCTGRAMISAKSKRNIRVNLCVFTDGVLGCFFDHCKKIEFSENRLENWSLWGVYCIHSENLLFTRNICNNCNDGLKFGFYIKDAIISENICVNNDRDGIDYAGFGAKNVEISRNKLINNTIYGIEFKTLNRESEGHNYNLAHHGYRVSELDWNSVKIVDNEIKNNNKLKSSTGIGHVMFYGDEVAVKNVLISGNTIEANNGLYIVGLNKNRLIVESNTIKSVEYGITIASASEVVVRNTVIKNNGSNGVGVRVLVQETTGSTNTHVIKNVSLSNVHIESQTCVSIGETVSDVVEIRDCILRGINKLNIKSKNVKLKYVSNNKESF